MTTPVTAVICAYNAEATIAEALGSLCTQTVSTFDVVVIDDGSTDTTTAVVERLSAAAPVSVRVVRTVHGGLAAARNHGVAAAEGEYLTFLDADDLLAPNAIQLLLEQARRTKAEITVCDMLYTDFETGDPMHVYHQGAPALYRGSLAESPGLLPALSGSACGKLFTRSLFARSGIRFPDGRIFEDLWTVYRLCAEATSIAKVDEPLYIYRQSRAGSLMSVYDDRYLDIIEGLAVTNDYFAEKGLLDPLREDLIALNFYHGIYGRYTNLLTQAPRDVRRRYLHAAFVHLNRSFRGWRRSTAIPSLLDSRLKRMVFTHESLLGWLSDLRSAAV